MTNAQSGIAYSNFPTTNSSAVFYWIYGASNLVLKCSAALDGVTISNQAVFNVLAPYANLHVTTDGPVVVDDEDFEAGGASLHWGLEPLLSPIPITNYGIAIWATNFTLNGCPGTSQFIWAQTGTIQAEHNYTNGQSIRYSGSGIDLQYPAGGFWPETPLPFDDQPAEPVDGSAEVWRSDSFTTYLLFQIPDSNSIPVPLKKVQWSWSGLAQTNGAGGWQVLSSSTAVSNINVNAYYPTWTSNAENGVTIQSSSWILPFP